MWAKYVNTNIKLSIRIVVNRILKNNQALYFIKKGSKKKPLSHSLIKTQQKKTIL